MNFQMVLNALQDALRETRSSYHLTLGGLIDYLQIEVTQGRGNLPVVFSDDCTQFPTSVGSYRGYFSDLAIAHDGHIGSDVEKLLDMLRNVLDRQLIGYKGGEFIMDGDTPLWRANDGEAPNDAIMGVSFDGYKVILAIQNIY